MEDVERCEHKAIYGIYPNMAITQPHKLSQLSCSQLVNLLWLSCRREAIQVFMRSLGTTGINCYVVRGPFDFSTKRLSIN